MKSVNCSTETKVRCPACRAGSQRLLGEKNQYPLYQCSRCSVVFTPRREDASGEVRELYDHYYDNARFAIPPVVQASLQKLVLSFSKFRRTGCWLDVGYGEGGLLEAAERQGWRCYGTEISPASLRYGEQRGWVVSADGTTDSRFLTAGFDVVTMIELLEHVPAPDQLLRTAARWLRPGGVLYVTTPNARSFNWRLLGLNWSVVSPPEHLTLWTPRGLALALRAAGFRAQQTRTEGLNPRDLLTRFWPRRNSMGAASRNEVGFALNEAFSRSPLRRTLKAGINGCLSFLRIGDSLKVRAIR